jgi:hypothetical protein
MEPKSVEEFVKDNWLGDHGWTQKGGCDLKTKTIYWECESSGECCLLNYWNERRVMFHSYPSLDCDEHDAEVVEVPVRKRQDLFNFIVYNLDRTNKS